MNRNQFGHTERREVTEDDFEVALLDATPSLPLTDEPHAWTAKLRSLPLHGGYGMRLLLAAALALGLFLSACSNDTHHCDAAKAYAEAQLAVAEKADAKTQNALTAFFPDADSRSLWERILSTVERPGMDPAIHDAWRNWIAARKTLIEARAVLEDLEANCKAG